MNSERELLGKTRDGKTISIIKIHIPASKHRSEFYNLYRVPGYPHAFLNARKAWDKAEELANE